MNGIEGLFVGYDERIVRIVLEVNMDGRGGVEGGEKV